MLDRESHNHSTIVQWSTDGSSFIINDQDRFEAVSIRKVSSFNVAFISNDITINSVNSYIATAHNSNVL